MLKFSEHRLHSGQRADPIVHGFTTGIMPLPSEAAQPLLDALKICAEAIEFGEPLAQPGEQSPRFFARIMFFKPVFHAIKRPFAGLLGNHRERL